MVSHEDGITARCSEEAVPSLVPSSPASSPTSMPASVQALSPSSCGADAEVMSVSSMSFDPQPEPDEVAAMPSQPSDDLTTSTRKRKWHAGKLRCMRPRKQAESPTLTPSCTRPGPETVGDLANWPKVQARELFAHPDFAPDRLRARAESFFSAGMLLATDFSGRMCAEAAMRMQLSGMRQAGAKIDERSLISYSASELSTSCRPSIMNSKHKPHHLFEHVSTFLPAEAAQDLVKFRPPRYKKKARSQEENARRIIEARTAYNKQKDYIEKNKEALFPANPTGKCLIHNAQCKCFFGGLQNALLEQQPLSWNLSGPMCVAFTQAGLRKGDADPTSESWNIHATRMAMSNHDLFTIENSALMPLSYLDEKIQDQRKWILVPLIVDTCKNGWAARRRRSYRTCVNDSRLIWLGPRDPASIQKLFDKLFNREVNMCADDFLISQHEEHDSFARSIAAKNGNYVRDDAEVEPKHCMTAAGFQRFQVFQQAYNQSSQGQCFVGDISQNMMVFNRSGNILPATMTSTRFYSFSQQRFFTPKDLAFSQGWPVLSTDTYPDIMMSGERSTHGEFHSLGNGMHLSSVGQVMLFMACFTLRKEVALKLVPVLPQLRAPDVEVEAGESEVAQ